MRKTLIMTAAGAALALGAAGLASAQSVDDLLRPPGPTPGPAPGPSTGPTPGPAPAPAPANRPNPTEDDFQIGPNRQFTTGHAIQRFLQKQGYPAQLKYFRSGTPYVLFKMERKTVIVRFFQCNKRGVKQCISILIAAGYTMNNDVPLDTLNSWNARWRYTYAYRRPNRPREVWLNLDLTFAKGMLPSALAKYFDLFRANELRFRRHIGFRL